MPAFDCIVLGLGGVGSAALYHLARRGVRALGIERWRPGHDRGSSHGHSRIIRKAYFEHADYVPLLLRAYKLWDELEQDVDEQLFYRVGLAQFGPPDGSIIQGIEQSAQLHNLSIERPTAEELANEFPQFTVPDGMSIIIERDAGVLAVERCVVAHAEQARRLGAEIVHDDPVREIRQKVDSIELVLESGSTHEAARLVLAAGAWSHRLAGVGIPLRVVRKHLHWIELPNRPVQQLPAFFYDMPDGYFYGTPGFDGQPIKVAEHSGGDPVSDPTSLSRQPDNRDTQRIDAFTREIFASDVVRMRHDVCMYTMSPDEHFIVDHHPQHEAIVFAAGLSGHGFKFTSVLGEALADLALEGHSELPIEFLSLRRFDAAS